MSGQSISHYRILDEIGKWGVGVVYLAEDVLLGRGVAIKTLTTTATLSKQHHRARFLREARAISALSHPHIANVYDYGETEASQPYIVTELVNGQTLSEIICDNALTLARAIEIIRALAVIGAFERVTLGFFESERKDYKKISIGEQVEVMSNESR